MRAQLNHLIVDDELRGRLFPARAECKEQGCVATYCTLLSTKPDWNRKYPT